MADAADPAAAAAAMKFIAEVWGLQGTAYLVVALRYYSKVATVGVRGLAWDDFIMFLAVLVYSAESVMAYLVVAYWKGLANNAMTDEQRAALDPESAEWLLRVNGSKTHITGLLLYTTLLWLLKACWLVYYARLTEGVHNMRWRIKWGIIMVSTTYVACLLIAFLKCIPFEKQWQINPSPGNFCMPAISSIQTIFVMIMNTLTDFYLMAIPLPIVWNSRLPPRKKFALLIMFSGGLLEMAFGILRCVSILTLGDIDPAQSGYWSVRESFVSVVLTNMPMIYPIFKGIIDKGRSASRSRVTSNSNGYRLESVNKRTTNNTRNKDQYSIPETRWGSKEQIIVDEQGRSSSSGKESSLDLPDQEMGMGYQISTAHTASATKDHAGPPKKMASENKILVTTEYTVQDGGPKHSRTGRSPDSRG